MFSICFDVTDVFTVLHPYYKLEYIKITWGGPEEQEQERTAGNPSARDWHDEALKIMKGLWRTIGRLATPPLPHIYQLSPHQALPLSQYQNLKALTVTPLLWNLSLTSIVVCSL
jgi:hypothetical protein